MSALDDFMNANADTQSAPRKNGVFATAYSPQAQGDKTEGDYHSAVAGPDGKALVRTLDDYRLGQSKYVTLAGDPSFYGRGYTIPSITYQSNGKTYTLKNVPGVVHDTGDAFKGAPEGRFDVAVGKDLESERNQSLSGVTFTPMAGDALKNIVGGMTKGAPQVSQASQINASHNSSLDDFLNSQQKILEQAAGQQEVPEIQPVKAGQPGGATVAPIMQKKSQSPNLDQILMNVAGKGIEGIGNFFGTVADPNYDWKGAAGTLGVNALNAARGGAEDIGRMNAAAKGQGLIPVGQNDTSLGGMLPRVFNALHEGVMQYTPAGYFAAPIIKQFEGNSPAQQQAIQEEQAREDAANAEHPTAAALGQGLGQTVRALPYTLAGEMGAGTGLARMGIAPTGTLGRTAAGFVKDVAGGATGAIPNTPSDENLLANAGQSAVLSGAISPLVRGFSLEPVNKFYTATTTPEVAEAAMAAKRLGVDVGGAELLHDPELQQEALRIAGYASKAPQQMTQQVMKQTGADGIAAALGEPGYTPKVVQGVRQDLGQQYDKWALGNGVSVDPVFEQNLADLKYNLQYENPDIRGKVGRVIDNILGSRVQNMQTGQWVIPGQRYLDITQAQSKSPFSLSKLNSDDPVTQQYYQAIKSELDDAVDRFAQFEDPAAQQLKSINRKYAINEDVATLAPNGSLSGTLQPSEINKIADKQVANGNTNFWDDVRKATRLMPNVDAQGRVPQVRSNDRLAALGKSMSNLAGPAAAFGLGSLVEGSMFLPYVKTALTSNPFATTAAGSVLAAAALRNHITRRMLQSPNYAQRVLENTANGAQSLENPFSAVPSALYHNKDQNDENQ